MRVLIFLLLLVPQLAAAKVFMCVDEVTGKKSFTDRGCQTAAVREEVKVRPTNANSGKKSETQESDQEKAWVSDRDTRKTGRDYNVQSRRVADISPTPGLGADAASGDI